MIIKAFQVKNTSINNYNMFLLYGENEGFKNQVIANISEDYKPNILKYEEDELIKNSDIFFSEVNNIYNVSVDFISEIITSSRNSQDQIISGDPEKIKTVSDTWKFSKDKRNNSPAWLLVETQS